MLAKLSVDQALMKAKSHAKKGEIAEAKNLYEVILYNFSQNKRAQQGLADLNKIRLLNTSQNPPKEVVDQLIKLYKQGQFSLVVEHAQALTKQYPESFIFWSILGASAAEIGMADQAIIALKKVISIKPDYADAYDNIGVVFQSQGKLVDAINNYKKSILLNSSNANPYYNMANILKDQDKLDEAIEAYKKSIELKPDHYKAYANMATTLQKQGKLEEAIEAYKNSISLMPNYGETYSNMGNALQQLGKLDEAIDAHKKSILLNPNYALAYNNMGNVLQQLGKLDEAVDQYKKSICLDSNYYEAYSNMGVALKDQGNLDEAKVYFEKALSLNPNHASSYNNLGNLFQYQGKIEEAIYVFRKSISLNPDFKETYLNLSLSLLQSGQIKEGLEEYEWRWKTKKGMSQQRKFKQPLWDGKRTLKDKTILLWCEQGIGDTMNWSSCLSIVTSRAKHVILECQKKLVPLLSRSFPNVEVKAENRILDADRDDFDLHLPMGSLYKHFIDEIMIKGMASSYLVPDPVRVQHWKERLRSIGKGPYIGVCWKSSIKSAYRLQHYPSMSEWAAVFKVPDVTFINLQYTDYEEDIAKVEDECGVKIHNFEDIDQYGDIDEVAALCAALDVVVSTKATPSMISVGVGTPTKIINWRQSSYNTILTNPQSTSLEMIHKDTWEPWDKVFNIITDDILKLKKW